MTPDTGDFTTVSMDDAQNRSLTIQEIITPEMEAIRSMITQTERLPREYDAFCDYDAPMSDRLIFSIK